MNIGIFIGYLNPHEGGRNTFTNNIINEIINYKDKHTFHIFYYGNHNFYNKNSKVIFRSLGGFFSLKYSEILRYLFFHKIPIISSLYKYSKLNRYIKKNNISLIWFPNMSYEEVIVPFFINVWDLEHRKQPYFPEILKYGWVFDKREAFFKNVLIRASKIIIGTHEGKDEVIRFYNIYPNNVKVVRFFTPEIREVKSDNTNTFGKYILYPAQFWFHKNHKIIIEAVKVLKDRYNLDLNIVFTGSDKGNLNSVLNFAKELGVSNHLKYLGFVKDEELADLYSNSVLLVYPSLFGPDNLPPLEAMNHKCPVITADIPGARSFLEDGALYFDPHDYNQLADKIHKIIVDSDLRKKLIEKGTKIAQIQTVSSYIKCIIDEFDKFYRILDLWNLQS